MLRKHRFFIAGMALTMVIVLLCMILPGQLLKLQSRRHVGEIIRADQEYYADNVSALDTVDFNAKTRVAMFTDQWKCEKTPVQAWKLDGAVVLDDEIRAFAHSIFKILQKPSGWRRFLMPVKMDYRPGFSGIWMKMPRHGFSL